MDFRLEMAAQGGEINDLYELINQNPHILQGFDDIPFVVTPLHLAAAAGRTHFAVEIMRLQPSFRRKLDTQGLSPLHLALQNGRVETARRLVENDRELVRVQGREGITPLHLVANSPDGDCIGGLLAEFLLACPLSIEDLTIRGESALHIAVKNRRIETLKVLVGWLKWMKKQQVLDWKDENGDTVLHTAAATNQPQAIRIVINNENKVSLNSAGLTALDVVYNLPISINTESKRELQRLRAHRAKSLPISKNYLADYISSTPKIWDWFMIHEARIKMGLSVEAKSTLLVVAALIMTITYQGVLSPPGGFRSQTESGNTNEREGMSVMEPVEFWIFGGFNTAAFLFSALVIINITESLLPDNYFFPVHLLISSYYLAILYISSGPHSSHYYITVLGPLALQSLAVLGSPGWDLFLYYFPKILLQKKILRKLFACCYMSHDDY